MHFGIATRSKTNYGWGSPDSVMRKNKSILELLDRLKIAAHDWVIADHWDSDLCAIGIATKAELRQLVYVSTYGKARGRYYFECEAPLTDSAEESVVTESADDVGWDELLGVLVRHLDTVR